MAKVVTKPAEVVAKKTTKPKATTATANIQKVSESILDKLKTLNIEAGLQSDIVWCLGSYKHDRNPVGLLENATKALAVFKAEQAKKTKGVTAKLISDIEKVLAAK